MRVLCNKCDRWYDDENQWTICPHGPLAWAPERYCARCDVVVGITMKGPICGCGRVALKIIAAPLVAYYPKAGAMATRFRIAVLSVKIVREQLSMREGA